MDREPKPNGNEHDESPMHTIRERIENLFPSREKIPTPMNARQTDQLKARIGELEAELAQHTERLRMTPEIVPPAKPSDTVPLPRGRRSRLASKILLPALLVFALAMGGFFLYSYLTTRADNQARQEQNSRQAEEIFNSEIGRLGDFALGLAIDAANNPDIQAAFADRDRAELTRLTLSGYRALDAQFNVPQYQYHLPPATSFLRLHSLDKYGDDLSSIRATVLQVNQTLQPVVGLEVGRGGLGLRGIEPVFYQGQHIGSVEYGLNIDQSLTANLKQSYGYDWRIILTREALALATLEDISALQEGPTPDLLVLASTLDAPVFAEGDAYQKALGGGRILSVVETGTGASYSATTLPLRDYSGNVIGVVDIFIDQTVAVQAQNSRLLLALSAALLIMLVGGAILVTATNRSLRPLTALTRAAELVERGNLDQRVTVGGRDEIGQLAHTFNAMLHQLRNLVGSLEQRVVERTHDLELATEVGRAITENIADPLGMLTRAVETIRARFNLYYTQIYLVDPSGHALVLRAGTGEVGRQLLLRGHRLAIGPGSLNGRAATERRAILVTDTAQSADFLPNPLLPNTRSEMVVPLTAGTRVIGILDMQSETPGALNEFNLPAFEALAGQLTVAIQNADLFAEMEAARRQVEMNASQLAESGWMGFLNAIERGEHIGYVYDGSKNAALDTSRPPLPPESPNVPITVAGAAVGSIQAVLEDQTLSTREIQILEATAAQLGQHLDNLRLLAQADQYRRQAEEVTRHLTREGWNQYLRARETVANGFLYDQGRVRPLEGPSSDEVAYRHPLTVRNEMLGQVEVAEPKVLSQEEAAELIGQVAASLGQHIENLRLLEQTEESRAEIEQSQGRLSEALDIARLGHWEYDVDRDIFTFNDHFYSIFHTTADKAGGYELSSADYARLFVHPDDVSLVGSEIGKALTATERYYTAKLEHRVIFADDGSTGYISVSVNVERDETGKIIRWYGANQDITERKNAETALRESERRYQQILDAITDMVLVKGDKSRIVWANKAFRDYYGMSNEQMRDMIDAPSVEPDYTLQYIKDDAYVYETGNILQIPEEPVTRHDGMTLLFETVKSPIRDIHGNMAMTVGVSRDITERKRAQETLRRRANQLETVAVVSSTASTVLDPDSLLQAVVDLTRERFNLYHAHIYLADEAWQTLLLAVGAGEVGRQMVTQGHAIPMDAEKSLVARAARGRLAIIVNDVQAHAGFLPNPLLPETRAEMSVPMVVGDRVLGVFDVQSDTVDDFTEEDANIYTTLAAQVAVALQNARLYVEQAATVTQLRELDRLKSSFLANMSHELRTPLNSILGFADVMLEGLDGDLTPNMENDLGLIQKNGKHLLHLINDVLDMAKIEAGKMNLSLERFSLQEVLEEVTSIIQPFAAEKSLSVDIDPTSDSSLYITADRTRIRQVMLNVVNNAIKFTESGQVSVRFERRGDRSLTSICDTGISIPPDKLEAIFQEFTQVDSSSTRKSGGTGLGLPISRRLVEMHGGRMWAESSGIGGEGSTFFIELPIEALLAEPGEKTEK